MAYTAGTRSVTTIAKYLLEIVEMNILHNFSEETPNDCKCSEIITPTLGKNIYRDKWRAKYENGITEWHNKKRRTE